MNNENSRKNFLLVLGTAALAGCGSATGLIPGGRHVNEVCPQDGVRRTESLCGAGGGLPSDLSSLTASQIQALTTNQIYGLTSTQIGSLTNDQLPVFTSAQCVTFHGLQASAILTQASGTQKGAPPLPTVANPPPPPYTPETPHSGFWEWIGGVVGGVVGGFGGGVATGGNPVGVFLGGVAGSTALGGILGAGSSATFNFWNGNAGQWQSVDISLSPAQSMLDSDGYTVAGSYDYSSNTVTITVIGN